MVKKKSYTLKAEPGKRNLVDYAANLNPEQYEVVTEADGPCLVLAGAGSGKTRTLIYRVAYLLDRGIDPHRILLVTFTNKAAREMLDRVEGLLKFQPRGLWGGTFHHLGNICLRRYASRLGYTPEFSILDREDSKDLIKSAIRETGIDPKDKKFPKAAVVEAIINFAGNSRQDVEEAIKSRYSYFEEFIPDIKKVAGRYVKKKKETNSMDFDDLLINWLFLLEEIPEAQEYYSKQFQHILVDEYQDTNRLQFEIVRLLSDYHKNLLVVGDDAQSIYSFRAAEIRNILDFPERFPGAKIFKLETNYRSTPEILGLANESIKYNAGQYPKELKSLLSPGELPAVVPLRDSREESVFIAQRALELRDEGIPLREIAVLFRARYQAAHLEMELQKRNIPYVIRGGMRFFEQAHIKDVLSYLKIIANPRDELSWKRALRLQRGIGSASAQKIWLQVSKGESPLGMIKSKEMETIVPKRAKEGWQGFLNIVETLTFPETRYPAGMIREIVKNGYDNYVQLSYEDASERLEDLEQLAVFAQRYRALDQFLSDVTLQEGFRDERGQEARKEDEYLVLSTIHQAKGLEWHTVIIMGVVEKKFPHLKSLSCPKQLEEERRLFYVAVTRTRSGLYLTYPGVQFDPQQGLISVRPSMFILELSEDCYQVLEVREESGTY